MGQATTQQCLVAEDVVREAAGSAVNEQIEEVELTAMSGRGGFSLIEILVVITIIGLLIALSTGAYSTWIERGEVHKTENIINNLKVFAEEYCNLTGDFPPSTLDELGVISRGDAANEGVEAFVLALYKQGYTGPRPSSESELINSDEDSADRNISEFGNPVLLEFQDAWANPIVYINCRDYAKTYTYLIEDREMGQEFVEIRAFKNPVTGSYFNHDSYQIISAGPDGVIGDEDDVANFNMQQE